MQFSTPPKKAEIKSTSVSLLVSLFLILLTIFIILSSTSSYDPNKQLAVKQSVEDKFGKNKKPTIIFGRLQYLKIDDHAIAIEKVIKNIGTVTINTDDDKLKISIPLEAIYFTDEPNFRSSAVDTMMQLMSVLKNWTDSENVKVEVSLSETNFEQDEQRLDFFRKYITSQNPLIGLKLGQDKKLDITIERTS